MGTEGIAALAVRQGAVDLVEKGLDDLFASNATQDYRDIISGLTLCYDALVRLHQDADAFLLEYGHRHPKTKEHIEVFVARTQDLKSLASGGYKVVHDPEFRYEYSWR